MIYSLSGHAGWHPTLKTSGLVSSWLVANSGLHDHRYLFFSGS